METMSLRQNLLVFFFALVLESVLAEVCNEPNVPAIVIASVFGTLAVVLVIAGIVLFFLWRRRRDRGKPTRKTPTKGLPTQGEPNSPEHGYSNPAFDDVDGPANIVDAEEGLSRTNGSPGKLQSPKGFESANKTWMSLPRADFPAAGLHRQGSCGSLDDNYLSLTWSRQRQKAEYTFPDPLKVQDPEVINVWLQSQDFIGLGFNISGSMRDGIFVSQVNNRGPAIESGKIKVGDRILSVTISFENMVFEDALTILSYASPYPVKVTLQKEKLFPDEQNLSGTNVHLSHPFYRSQSVDALTRIGKESLLKPKRTYSEMKPETRKQIKKSTENESSQNNSGVNGISGSHFTSDNNNNGLASSDLKYSDIGMHGLFLTSGSDNGVSASNDEKPSLLSDIIVHSRETSEVHLNGETRSISESSNDTETESKHNDDGDQLMSASTTIHSSEDPQTPTEISSDFADIFSGFSNINSLKLASEPKSDSVIAVAGSAEASLEDGDVSSDFKPPPRKPERRNKKSPSTDSSFDDGSHDNTTTEDIIQSTSISTVHAAPNGRVVNEVLEDHIVPQKKDRNVSLGSTFDFTPVELGISSLDMDDVSSSFTSISACTSTPMKALDTESHSPVDEDVITPSKATKDKAEPQFPRELTPQKMSLKNDTFSGYEELEKEKLNSSSSSNDSSISSNDGQDPEPLKQDDPDEFIIKPIESGFDIFKLRPSTKIKEGSSGVSYNISMSELNDIEEDIKKSRSKGNTEHSSNRSNEVRNQFSSGWPSLEKSAKLCVNRTVSDNSKPPPLIESEAKTMRVSSVKSTEKKAPVDIEPVNLEWSGKRLVRSGSFSSIPHDDGSCDWTDKTESKQKTEESSSELLTDEKIRIDADKTLDNYHGLGSAYKYQAMENLSNLSDLTDSNPSSRSASPFDANVQNGATISLTKPLVFKSDSLHSPSYQNDYEDSRWSSTGGSLLSSTTYQSPSAYTVTMTYPPSDDAEC